MESRGETLGGRYALEREIGRGSMGRIWVALDLELRRRVALKRLRAELLVDDDARRRFQHEARAIAQFRNEHVVQIFDYGVDDKTPFFVMELLDGETLEDRLARVGRLSLVAAAEIARQIATALVPAHATGMIHRDLKPANIFMARTDRGESVKLLDFGVAAIVAGWANSTVGPVHPGEIAGTPQFMSPEQIKGQEVDSRSDLWAMAVIVYRMLTGRWPFDGATFAELRYAVSRAEIAPPSRLVPELPAGADGFFERALARAPADRFQSAADLACALGAIADAIPPGTAHILIIDDEPDMETLLRQRFRKKIADGRYELFFATDGAQGLEELRRHPEMDLALSDIRMPGMDGLGFLTGAIGVNPLMKVVMLSAYGDMDNVRRAMNLGAFDFLIKPIDFQDLELTIEKSLKHTAGLRQALRSTEENDILRLFVANGLVDRLVAAIRATTVVGNEALEGSVVFIDVHGISGLLSSLSPDAIFRRLNQQFDVVIPEITRRAGMVDKFIGHTALAVFSGHDHLERALAACLAARERVAALEKAQGPESAFAHGLAVGVDAGTLASGCLGSRGVGRFDHAVLGDAVCTAAQLQAVAGKNEILVSDTLLRRLDPTYQLEPLGTRAVEGTQRKNVQVHRLLGMTAAVTPSLRVGAIERRAAHSSDSTARQEPAKPA